jgi:hypothetical protein
MGAANLFIECGRCPHPDFDGQHERGGFHVLKTATQSDTTQWQGSRGKPFQRSIFQ